MYASSSSSSSLTSLPASQYFPELGESRHPIKFISVDLPDPDGPMMATYSPRSMEIVTPRSAWISSPPITYVFQMSCVWIKDISVRTGQSAVGGYQSTIDSHQTSVDKL